jgi:hypothetical protein
MNFKSGSLAPSRADRLASIRGWRWDPLDAAWEKGFGHLITFASREGHGAVPTKHMENGFRLGAWAARQRQAQKVGSMPASRKTRLEAVAGWLWDTSDLRPGGRLSGKKPQIQQGATRTEG